jgi:hypothetical protein
VRALLQQGLQGRFLYQRQVGGDAVSGYVYALDEVVRGKSCFQDTLNLVSVKEWQPGNILSDVVDG